MYRDVIQTVLKFTVELEQVLQVNGGGVDRSLDQVVPGDLAPVESNTIGKMFFFGRKNQMIVSTCCQGWAEGWTWQ